MEYICLLMRWILKRFFSSLQTKYFKYFVQIWDRKTKHSVISIFVLIFWHIVRVGQQIYYAAWRICPSGLIWKLIHKNFLRSDFFVNFVGLFSFRVFRFIWADRFDHTQNVSVFISTRVRKLDSRFFCHVFWVDVT